MTIQDFFFDPVLMAPTIGSMLICLISALIGTFIVLRRYSLVGEMLSHASYPGVVIALVFSSFVFNETLFFLPLIGAAVTSLFAMVFLRFLEKKHAVSADSALAFILATFLGIGLTILTAVQKEKPALYKQIESYLFGQAATMTTTHVWFYLVIAILTFILIVSLFRTLQCYTFDSEYSYLIGIPVKAVEFLLQMLLVFAVIVGIRSVGVVLMSSMLIFPAVTARFWTHRLSIMLTLAAIIGLITGFLGVYTSHSLSEHYRVSIATGPTIVLVASVLFFFSALFSFDRGLIVCWYRRVHFWFRCQKENVLKAFWKCLEKKGKREVSVDECQALVAESWIKTKLLIFLLERRALLKKKRKATYCLTKKGLEKAKKIVRLHRLWEVYLVEYCGASADRVHPSAEEMEHIITKELEIELRKILQDPMLDPHQSPIPKMDEKQ